MNTYMVGKAAQALANTIIDHGPEAVKRALRLVMMFAINLEHLQN